MKKSKSFIKKSCKMFIGLIIGAVLAGTGVYAATAIVGGNVSYSPSSSGLSSTNVQDALDEVYSKMEIKNKSNIVQAYTYNASTCVTGNESACVITTCYKSTTSGSCPIGTIIQYKVNDLDVVTFHVMYDNGTTMTMQSHKNIIDNIEWISKGDYGGSSYNDKGPLTALVALERATRSWTNVNDQTYTMGSTGPYTYTGCTAYNACWTSSYSLASRTAKARIITLQEAVNLGCTESFQSCPIWMYNYLYYSTSNGGTINDANSNGYWTMNAHGSSIGSAWSIRYNGTAYYYSSTGSTENGVRAVVVVNK